MMWYRVAFVWIVGFILLCVPVVSVAAGLIPDCSVTGPKNSVQNPCGFAHLVELANNLLRFMVTVAAPLAAIAFAYAGFLYLTAAGNTGQISRAHGIFKTVAIGLGIVLSAWLIVDVIVDTLVEPGTIINVL